MYVDSIFPEGLRLTRNTADVWIVRTCAGADVVADCLGCLSGTERETAKRFHFAADHDRFVICRATLRAILSGCLGTSAAAISFAYNKFGKPELTDSHPRPPLQFNVSHSGDRALIAVTPNDPIGVDLEFERDLDGLQELVRTCFSPHEQAVFRRAGSEIQRDVFFCGWTRKEAFIKATGEGLSRSLDSFDVSLDPAGDARLLRLDHSQDSPDDWKLIAFEPANGYRAAVAVRNPQVTLRLRSLSSL